MLKDYFKILELGPDASQQDIRKSFRRLAMRYHPDKHGEDQVATAHFREIQEAYEVLTDPWRREQYLQERWYAQSMGKRMRESAPETSSTVLKELLHLEKHLSQQDPYRTDQYGLFAYLEHILSDQAISILCREQDRTILPEIQRLALACGNHFPYLLSTRLADRLRQICPLSPDAEADIRRYLRRKKREALWQRWKIPALLLITALICFIIFRAA